MFNFRNLRIRTRLSWLVVISSIGFAVFAAYAFYILGVIRVNGPIYQGLAQDQELVADILPPPSYIIESHLVAALMLDDVEHNEIQSINTLLERAAALQADYEVRHTYWVNALASTTDNDIAQTLLVDSYQPAQTYFQIFNDQFIPAIRSGQVEKADEIFHEQLIPVYEAHRISIEKVVALQKAAIKENEDNAQLLVLRSSSLLILLALLTVAVAIGFGIFISRSITAPVDQLTHVANQITRGELDARAPSDSKDEIGILAGAFNSMTAQLRDMLASLEQRVAARTKDLATVAEVGTATATILESSRLLQEVVNLTKERFNLYHSHIYLLDREGKTLVLTAGAGEPGRIMVAEKLSIPLDREQSLVARAARERKGVTVNDVTQAPDFLPNPLLPETRSELAVPMIVAGNVIGVFDIQSERVGRFTESDVNIQTTLAAQLATSIQNVRSFEQSKRQADFESQINLISQKIQRTTSIEETLQTAIRELGSAVGASRVSVNIAGQKDAGNNAGQN